MRPVTIHGSFCGINQWSDTCVVPIRVSLVMLRVEATFKTAVNLLFPRPRHVTTTVFPSITPRTFPEECHNLGSVPIAIKYLIESVTS